MSMAADGPAAATQRPTSSRERERVADSKGSSYSQRNGPYSQFDSHRSAPQSVDAEYGVLGSMLIAPNQAIPECVERINGEYFSAPTHTTIYNALVEMWNEQKAIDLITFTKYLRDRTLLEQIGGAPFVTHLFTFVPTAANVLYYLGILREKYVLRQIISVCTVSMQAAYDEQ